VIVIIPVPSRALTLEHRNPTIGAVRFENQAAIVTGAGRGIGHAIAVRLASEGARVACVSRNEENAKRTAEELNVARADSAKAYAVDVADHAAVQEMGSRILEDFGKIDILVNNAGITRDQLVMRMKRADWDAVLNTNLTSAYLCIQQVIGSMLKQRWGRIINITSIFGQMGQAGQANYAASKAGLIGLTMAMAREVASRNITCNAVAPGFIETSMTAALSEELKQTAVKMIPLGKVGTPDDVASAVGFLASDEASYITGHVLNVNGGMLMG
jgi:3-oxoacyl-[acyl-carrier protein] reductase